MYYAQQPMGYGYVAPQAQNVKLEQTLTEDQIKTLTKSGGVYNFNPTVEEILHEMCNHTHNGQFCLQQIGNSNEFECAICGEKLNLNANYDPDVIKQCIAYLSDLFNDIKIKGNGIIPKELMCTMADSMVMMKKLPLIQTVVNKKFQKMNSGTQQMQGFYGPNANAVMNSVLGQTYGQPIMAPGMVPGAQAYGVPMGQPMNPGMAPGTPMGYGMPMGNPFAGAPMNPGMVPGAPMGYGMPQQPQGYPQQPVAYQPQQPVAPQPQQPQTPVAPQQPVADNNLVKSKKVFPD